MGTVAEALRRIFKADNPVKIIGTRHGEKLYETLLTREEMAHAEDLEGYYRVPADTRDLNYALYFTQGEAAIASQQEYHSHNTRQLNLEETMELLLKLDYIQAELRGEKGELS